MQLASNTRYIRDGAIRTSIVMITIVTCGLIVTVLCCQVFQKPWSVAMTSDKKVLVTDAGSSPGEGFVAVCDLHGNFLSYLAKVSSN